MTRLLLVFLLALSGIGGASVTAAWKLPIESRVPDHETDGRVRKLDKPPGESAFFEAGDELWEVSKALTWEVAGDPFAEPDAKPTKIEWKGEWLVWNARSGMFIARGAWSALQLLESVLGFQEVPTVIRSRVDVVQGGSGEDAATGNSRSLSLVSRSGEEARAVLDGFKVAVTITAAVSAAVSDASCDFSWPAGGEKGRWNVDTEVVLSDGVRTRVARQGEGPAAWEAWLTVSKELPDGTLLAQARWVETAAGKQPWKLLESGKRDLPILLWPNRELGIYSVPENPLVTLGGREAEHNMPEVVAPAELAEWVSGSFVDMEKLLRENGVRFDPGDRHFAGFDPRSSRVIIVADSEVHDLAEQIFSYGSWHYPPHLWTETNSASGGWGLFLRSGCKGGIWRAGGDVPELSFEIEPTIGSNDDIVDLRYKFDVVSGEASSGRIESATTLDNGKPQRVATHSKEGMEGLEVVLTGTVTGE